MANYRTINISLDHFTAEVAACPLVLPEAYQVALTELDPATGSATTARSKSPAGRFWRAAEKYLLVRFPHTVIDELVSTRDLLWFDQKSLCQSLQPTPLHQYLKNLTQKFLRPQGSVAVPRLEPARSGCGGIQSHEPPEAAARRAWQWLAFSLPPDLILAQIETPHEGPSEVRLLSEPIVGLLREGFAEMHLHYGVAFDFRMFWSAALCSAADRSSSGLQFDSFHSPGAESDEGRELATALVRAALVRLFLGEFLRDAQAKSQRFENWLNTFLQSSPANVKAPRADAAVSAAMWELSRGALGPVISDVSPKQRFLELQRLYSLYASVAWTRPQVTTLADVPKLDPLYRLFGFGGAQVPAPVQLQFLRAGFDRLQQDPKDETFAILFWQVERVRCMIYRHCIQRPLGPGMTNFIRFYERKGRVCWPIDHVLINSAAEICGRQIGLTSLEVRTSPKSNYQDQQKVLGEHRRRFQQLPGRPDGSRLETGLVLHFLRGRGRDWDQGLPVALDLNASADPAAESNSSHFRWAQKFSAWMREATAIGNAISSNPRLLHVLRAIDVCRDEPGVPTWVIAPLFHETRRLVNAADSDWRLQGGAPLPPLQTTVHAGEDFVHLATGLRLMDEAVCFLKLTGGDRVGHGLALGVDALSWAHRTHRIAMPREERWLDLIWEKGWHAFPSADFSSDRREFVDREIARLGWEIFVGQSPAKSYGRQPDSGNLLQWGVPDWVETALEFRRSLHDFTRLKRLGFPMGSLPAAVPVDVVERMLELYLTDRLVYQRGRTIEWVEARTEGPATATLQRLVRQRYADVGITIEINPVSNLLVGDLTDLESHPLWRLAPRLGDRFGPTIRMCIGSDDPFPFNTSLPGEYQFLCDTLVLAGRSHAEAREWLELLRRMGLESRFTRPHQGQ